MVFRTHTFLLIKKTTPKDQGDFGGRGAFFKMFVGFLGGFMVGALFLISRNFYDRGGLFLNRVSTFLISG